MPNRNWIFRAKLIAPDHPGLSGRTLVPGEPIESYDTGLLVNGARLPVDAKVGSRVSLSVRTKRPGWTYQLATSLTAGVVEYNHRFLPLGDDALLWMSMSNTLASAFQSYSGSLDASGNASATIVIPNMPELSGIELRTAFMAFDISDPGATAEFSNAVVTKIVR